MERETRNPEDVATIPLQRLDWVWFYPAGTLCNLACSHCLVNGGPRSGLLKPLSLAEFRRALHDVAAHQSGQPFSIGFTGGEVFVLKSPRFDGVLFPMVEAALQYGDLLILTNGLLADDRTLERLARIASRAGHAISYRISLDGATAQENDAIRYSIDGRPTFHRIIAALQRFVAHGFLPAVAYTYEGSGKASEVLARKAQLEATYRRMLGQFGLGSLELWGIPFFEQGKESLRRETLGLPHIASPGITNNCIATYAGNEYERFQCSYSRSFAKEADGTTGWYKCAVL
ncbi:MAG: hypothetical protein D6743_05785, partial [Calditrichaeota bacterium]